MCYHCATNPSIHHHHHHVAAVSSLLSHHGVAFTLVAVLSLPSQCRLRRCIIPVSSSQSHRCGAFAVALSQFCHRCYSVAFVIALSPFRRRRHGVAFTSVTVSSSPSQCHLHVGHGFVIAIAVSPSCWLRFHRCHCGVTFVVALLQCCRCSRVVVVPSLLHRHSFVVTIMVLPSSSHRHGFIVVMVLPSSSHCRSVIVTVSLSPLRCRLLIGRSFIIAITVSPSLSHRCSVVITVALLQLAFEI